MRNMLRHLGFVAILTGVLTACAMTDMPQGGGTLETFAHRVATSEVVLLWNCLETEPGLLRVVGRLRILGRRSRFNTWSSIWWG